MYNSKWTHYKKKKIIPKTQISIPIIFVKNKFIGGFADLEKLLIIEKRNKAILKEYNKRALNKKTIGFLHIHNILSANIS